MKGIIWEVPEFILEWRRRTGGERFDETWEGVLHMALLPSIEQQNLEGALLAWLRTNWMSSDRRVLHQVNLSPDDDWTNNFRIPDLVLLLPDATQFIREEIVQGAPSVVIEIHVPGDESYEKLTFYMALGVPEVWIIDCDSKQVELRRLHGDEYRVMPPNELGWLTSDLSGIELRTETDSKLGIRLTSDDTSFARLPD